MSKKIGTQALLACISLCAACSSEVTDGSDIGSTPDSEDKEVEYMTNEAISYQEAINVAKGALDEEGIRWGQMQPKTEELSNMWIVTFPRKLEKYERGGEFHAKVYVKKATGEIESIQVSP